MHAPIVLKPIGYVRHGYSDEEVKLALRGVRGEIEILPEYEEGLRGIDGFSHLIVISFLHKVGEAGRKVLLVKHRRLARFGVRIDDIPEVGVFATDSPHRPNPIALSIVKLLRREGNRLIVEGLDLFDGTPVLDIKPYDSSRAISDFRVPWWVSVLEERLKQATGEPGPI